MPSSRELLEELIAARDRLARAEAAERNAAEDEQMANRQWERSRLEGDERAAEVWRDRRGEAARLREDEARAKALLAERVAVLAEKHRDAEEREGEASERHARHRRVLSREARAFATGLHAFLREHSPGAILDQVKRTIDSQRELALRAGRRHYPSQEIRVWEESFGHHPGLAEAVNSLAQYEKNIAPAPATEAEPAREA